MNNVDRTADTTGATPISDLDQCVCSGKSLARLLRPAILAMLAQAPTHGYELAQLIAERNLFSDESTDPSGVYKTLKEMEKEGLLTSTWELGDVGPAERRYELSPEGLICLERWVTTLVTYRAHIDGLLELLAPRGKSLPVINQHPCACREGKSCCC